MTDDALHLALDRVAGVSDHDLGPLGHAGQPQIAQHGVEHRLEVTEVR
jgi:hypothetical protein